MNKRIKFKKKKKVFIILIGIILVLGIIILINYIKTINSIRNHYNNYVITTKNTYLYDKKKNIIGTINKDINLELESINIKKTSNKYYKIKNTNYYIYYNDTKKISKLEKDEVNSDYLVFNKNIQSKKKITLYKNKKKFITINKGLSLPIIYLDSDNYYVYYLNNILSIKKSKKIKEVDVKNTIEDEASTVSVLYYEKIDDNCSDDNCINTSVAESEISKLLESNYYTITKDEYEDYLNGYIRLKKNAVFITTSTDNDFVKSIENNLEVNIETTLESDNLKYTSTNKSSSSKSDKNSIDRYQIKSYTSIDNYLKMAGGDEVKESNLNTSSEQGIAVLNYHFFYDPALGEDCNEGICLEVSKFREELEYLKNNNYKTLTMDEFKRWMYGEIELPTKSVLITVDDGAKGTGAHNGNKLIPLLEEYKMHATLFLIAGWWDISNYSSPYLEVQSHTYDMHQYGSCKKGQLVCATYEEAKTDLEKSLAIVNNNDSFCYPFYSYSDTAIQAIKDTGFKLAFIGGNRKAKRSNNKYLIPRYPIHSDITMERFIEIVS